LEKDSRTTIGSARERPEAPEEVVLRRAARYHDAFPETDIAVIAAHIAVVRTGSEMRSAVSRHLDRYGINVARYSLMRALYFTPERMLPQSQIAREMGTSQPNVTQLLHALEKDGLVERVIYPENRRVTYARLKPEGIALCDTLVPDMVRFMETSMEGLTADELTELQRLLAKVSACAEALIRDGDS
jgi:MarR family 2-MHQ and catechol resistance regulon transcriptional repressor